MTNLAAILRSLAPTPEAAAVAIDKLHPLELAEGATAKPRAVAGAAETAAPDPRRLHHG